MRNKPLAAVITGAAWLTNDWKITNEDQARRLARPEWGIGAWLAVNLITGVLAQRVSFIGLPLVLLAYFNLRGRSPTWVPATLLALMAFVALARWTNGAAEWTSGLGEFNIVLVLFGARCAWATWVLPSVSRNDVVEAFS